MEYKKTCSWCNKKYYGYGHNSSFVNGRICDECNLNKEIPKRRNK